MRALVESRRLVWVFNFARKRELRYKIQREDKIYRKALEYFEEGERSLRWLLLWVGARAPTNKDRSNLVSTQ